MTAVKGRERGLTFLEMVATTAILMILASAILPLAKLTYKRKNEIELRRALREMRAAIDKYNLICLQGGFAATERKLGDECYPPSLEKLAKGTKGVGTGSGENLKKQLRRIPVDPMTDSDEWGLRCYQDDPERKSWCGENVWDVYTKSEGQAIDGTNYADW